jgi:hypothetical protein
VDTAIPATVTADSFPTDPAHAPLRHDVDHDVVNRDDVDDAPLLLADRDPGRSGGHDHLSDQAACRRARRWHQHSAIRWALGEWIFNNLPIHDIRHVFRLFQVIDDCCTGQRLLPLRLDLDLVLNLLGDLALEPVEQ